MIRFIDLGRQISCGGAREFAFYNTIPDMFVDFGGSGCQTWNCWEDFKEAFHLQDGYNDLDRFKVLCPEWVFTKKKRTGSRLPKGH
jgi:hypothetical protein